MSEKADTVPGLGFKDEQKAMETLKILEGRDPDYQRLAVRGLIGRAKRVLPLTKDKEKLQNINDAMKIFEDFMKEYEKTGKAKENRTYLPLATIKTLLPLKKKYEIEDENADAFLEAYTSVKGEYKHLRTVSLDSDDKTWDIVRNSSLKAVEKRINDDNPNLWDDDDLPTKEHMEMIVWAYSPDASKIKKNLSKIADKVGKDEDESSEDEEVNENGKEKSSKRKSEDSSSGSDEESPKKKSKH